MCRRPFDAVSRLAAFAEAASAAFVPRASKVLGVLLVVAGLKLGILAFLGLDLFLPDPPRREPAVAMTVLAVTPALAQTAPAAPAAQAAPAAPASQAAPAKPADKAAPAGPPSAADWQELTRRQDALNQKEQALNALEADLNARVAKLKDMEASIKTMLENAKGAKDEKLKHLIDVYSNMNAKQAGKVLETLDNGIAVKILAGMRGRQAGEILNNMDAKKAASLTELLTQMQLPADSGPPVVPAGS